MNNKLEQLAIEVGEKGIDIIQRPFAKAEYELNDASGIYALLWGDSEGVYLDSCNSDDTVLSFEDISTILFNTWKDSERSLVTDEWAKVWLEEGKIKEKPITVYEPIK